MSALTSDQAVATAFDLFRAGDAAAAERLFRQVLDAQPAHADALLGLGIIALETSHNEEAIDIFGRALAADRERVEVLSNLASAYIADERPREAMPHLRRALRTKPDSFILHHNLAVALHKLGREDEAEASVRRALALKPDHAGSHMTDAQICETRGWFLAAAERYRRLLRIDPAHVRGRVRLANALVQAGRADEGLANLEGMLGSASSDELLQSIYLLSVHYGNRHSAQTIFAAHAAFGAHVQASAPRLSAPRLSRAGRRLRVGYFSPDFRQHSVAFFFESLLARHGRSRFEVFCYYGNTFSDAITDRLRALAEHWIDCGHINDAALAARITHDGIDVLVDLAGPTAGGRPGVFARKPAPVQATWLGYPSSSGLTAMDVRISDWQADPAGYERYNTERLHRLPASYFCYAPPRDAPALSPPPCVKKGHVTFGSFNTLAKLSDDCVALWSDVLARVPGSRLLIKAMALNEPAAREATLARFAERGVAADRLVLRGWSAKPAEHLAAYREVDIALDTFPYNGATTTCDTLWMGVPVVSLAGERHVSRMGLSILSAAGHADWCAKDAGGYGDIAQALAADAAALGELRAGMRARLQASPLLDSAGFTSAFEALLEKLAAEPGTDHGFVR